MSKKSFINKITHKLVSFIDDVIEHHLFKPLVVAIISSFILFNIFYFLQNFFQKEKYLIKNNDQLTRIKINIPSDYYFNLSENQTLTHKVESGDTLLGILLNLGVNQNDIFTILNEMKKIYNPRLIKSGDEFIIDYQLSVKYPKERIKDETEKSAIINSIILNISAEEQIIINNNKNDGGYSYKAQKIVKQLTKHIVKYSAIIKNGLYVDGTEVGVSPNIMINMINLYSFDVDFQRDIRTGDKFEILFESYYDDKGNKIKDGNVLFASLDLQKRRTIDMYLYKLGNVDEYFDSKGNSIKKSLLRTPINGARISSGFGLRRHPVLGYSKMHKGIDFAAPTGTPIFAAGNGTIVYLDRNGGYGNFVKIKHNSKYYTAYAHASRFARGLRVGSKVKQGDVIAYVGTTGRSTGPHLHYEVILDGKQINPSQIKTTSGIKLKGKEFTNFVKARDNIDKYRKIIPNQNKF